jgi:hypothetical protein
VVEPLTAAGQGICQEKRKSLVDFLSPNTPSVTSKRIPAVQRETAKGFDR